MPRSRSIGKCRLRPVEGGSPRLGERENSDGTDPRDRVGRVSWGEQFESKSLFVLPSLGLSAVVVALLTGLSARVVRSAEVYGGPTKRLDRYSVRLFVRDVLADAEVAAAGEHVSITWRGPTSETEKLVQTGRDGWVETELRRPEGARSLDLIVRDVASGQVLAEGTPTLQLERWQAASRRGGVLRGRSEGPWFVEAQVREGILAVPFEGHLALSFRRTTGSLRGTRVRVSSEGVELLTPAEFTLEDEKERLLGLRPVEHVASIRLEMNAPDGATGAFASSLPVVPGAFFVTPAASSWTISSPLERDELWYAFVSDAGRGPGGRLKLEAAPGGTARGSLPFDARPREEGVYLVLSSSPDGRSPSTVGFPLDGQAGTFDAVDGRLLDGSARAHARESTRIHRVRLFLMAHVATVFALTLLLFVRRVRRADRELKSRLQRAGAYAAPVTAGSLWLAVAAFCLVVGFSLALVWISIADFGP